MMFAAFLGGVVIGWLIHFLWGATADRRRAWLLNRDLIAMEDANIEHFNSMVIKLKDRKEQP